MSATGGGVVSLGLQGSRQPALAEWTDMGTEVRLSAAKKTGRWRKPLIVWDKLSLQNEITESHSVKIPIN